MTWEPSQFTYEQRSAAGKAITQAHRLIDRLEFSAQTDSARAVLKQADDMLAMLYQDLYGASLIGDYPPPNAS
ncbi:hypothetical protein [Mycolicibacterium fortuitum]|uniref:hypothetical protein n=1 Tax=Mycolicibacterium fortuitum TaxID=1766 RepID=UPI00260BC562|nr:hypothetical protein [Mycolicibacterium fortuitum]